MKNEKYQLTGLYFASNNGINGIYYQLSDNKFKNIDTEEVCENNFNNLKLYNSLKSFIIEQGLSLLLYDNNGKKINTVDRNYISGVQEVAKYTRFIKAKKEIVITECKKVASVLVNEIIKTTDFAITKDKIDNIKNNLATYIFIHSREDEITLGEILLKIFKMNNIKDPDRCLREDVTVKYYSGVPKINQEVKIKTF